MDKKQEISLRARALRYLSMREHSRLELERKLQAHAQDATELTHLLDELEKRQFINEQRVVESVVHQQASRYGSRRVQQKLQEKGISPQATQHALEQLRHSEFERAQAVWQRKFTTPPSTREDWARQMRFLISRGFGSDIAARVLRAGSCASESPQHFEDNDLS